MRWALWWFAVFAAYVITVLTQNGSEIIAGAIIAAFALIIVAVALRNGDPGVRARWSWLRHLAGVPARMITDAVLVGKRIVSTLVAGGNLDGYFIRLPYDVGERDDPWTMGREGLAIFGISASPNSLVTEVDLRGELVLHKLVADAQPHASPQWPL